MKGVGQGAGWQSSFLHSHQGAHVNFAILLLVCPLPGLCTCCARTITHWHEPT